MKARGIDIGPEGFNSLLALCGAQGEKTLLLDAFAYMREKGVPLSEAAYVSVLRVKALGGEPEVGGWLGGWVAGSRLPPYGVVAARLARWKHCTALPD